MLKARFGSDLDRIVLRVFPFVRRIPLHPNSLTLIGVALSVAAAVAFFFEEHLAAGLLMILAGFCDLIDGVLARAQGTSSRAGAFFDSSMDRVSDLVIFAGIALAMAARTDVAGTLLVLWALSGSVMTSYLRARAEVELERLEVGLMERAERFGVLILGALTGFVVVALWVIAIGATITSIQRLVVANRELGKLPRVTPVPAPRPEPLEEVS